MKNQEIISRWDTLFNERQGTIDSMWDLVDRFVLPLRGDFYSTQTSEGEVDWRRRDLYDSTAVFAAQSLSAAMQSNLTSASQRWFELRFRNDKLNTEQVAKEWLDECTRLVYEALNESNFEIEIAEAYTDLVGFGTSILTEELDDESGEIVFSANPLRDSVFEQDYKKQIWAVYRRLNWTPVQIISKWGEENVPERVRQRAADPSGSTQRMDIIFAVYPRKGKAADPTKPTAPKERPYGYKYVLKAGMETLGEEGGYYEMPAFVSRWRTVAGSKWGKSPATDAMGDILTLNQLKEATLEAAAKAVDPPQVTEEENIVGQLDMDRGGLTTVTDIDGLKPLLAGTDFNVANLEVGWLTDSIRDHFYQDKLELKESPAMTATEVTVRYELMQRMMGPTLGRLKNDLLNPLIERTFNILLREKKLPEIPTGLPLTSLDIQYTGPLPRAQQGSTANEIMRWMGEMAQFAEVYPEAMQLPDVDEALRMVAEMRGVPAKAIRSQQELAMERAKQEQQKQAAMMMQAAQGAGEAMKSMGEGAQALQEGQGTTQ